MKLLQMSILYILLNKDFVSSGNHKRTICILENHRLTEKIVEYILNQCPSSIEYIPIEVIKKVIKVLLYNYNIHLFYVVQIQLLVELIGFLNYLIYYYLIDKYFAF